MRVVNKYSTIILTYLLNLKLFTHQDRLVIEFADIRETDVIVGFHVVY